MKALAVDANQRYESAGELLEAIESFAVGVADVAVDDGARPLHARHVRRHVQEPWLTTRRGSAPRRRRGNRRSRTPTPAGGERRWCRRRRRGGRRPRAAAQRRRPIAADVAAMTRTPTLARAAARSSAERKGDAARWQPRRSRHAGRRSRASAPSFATADAVVVVRRRCQRCRRGRSGSMPAAGVDDATAGRPQRARRLGRSRSAVVRAVDAGSASGPAHAAGCRASIASGSLGYPAARRQRSRSRAIDDPARRAPSSTLAGCTSSAGVAAASASSSCSRSSRSSVGAEDEDPSSCTATEAPRRPRGRDGASPASPTRGQAATRASRRSTAAVARRSSRRRGATRPPTTMIAIHVDVDADRAPTCSSPASLARHHAARHPDASARPASATLDDPLAPARRRRPSTVDLTGDYTARSS